MQVNGVPGQIYVHDIEHVDAYGALSDAHMDVFAVNRQAQTGSLIERLWIRTVSAEFFAVAGSSAKSLR